MKTFHSLSACPARISKLFCSIVLIVLPIASPALADVPYNPPYDFNWDWTPELSDPKAKVSPLCGDVVTAQPLGWSLGDDCPMSQWGKSDRIVSAYGPRKQGSSFDFHRGLDYRTVEMESDNDSDANGNEPDHETPIHHPRPVFAVTDGEFIGVEDGGDDGWLVIIAHRSRGIYTRYKHLSSVDPNVSGLPQHATIVAGQYLGQTGRSESGNHHLHFEVRKVTPDGDSDLDDERKEATWKRNAIHPMRLVPYSPPQNTTTVTVSLSAKNKPVVDLDTDRWDVRRVSLVTCIWNPTLNICNFPFWIPGSIPVDGYYINPPFTDFELTNYQYTHRGPSQWVNFQSGGQDECPYVNDPATAHGSDYDDTQHLDKSGTTVHTFNGVKTEVFGSSTHYHRTFTFEQAMMWSSGCAIATVHYVNGDTTQDNVCW